MRIGMEKSRRTQEERKNRKIRGKVNKTDKGKGEEA